MIGGEVSDQIEQKPHGAWQHGCAAAAPPGNSCSDAIAAVTARAQRDSIPCESKAKANHHNMPRRTVAFTVHATLQPLHFSLPSQQGQHNAGQRYDSTTHLHASTYPSSTSRFSSGPPPPRRIMSRARCSKEDSACGNVRKQSATIGKRNWDQWDSRRHLHKDTQETRCREAH